MTPSFLRTEQLRKSFGPVLANDGIDLDLRAGELHCLFGENGAGKSTLSACLYGYQRPDSGRIVIKGEPVVFSSPADAIARGIGMVHQHFVLVEAMTVLENITLGTHKAGWRLGRSEAAAKIARICTDYDLTVKLDAFVWQLSVGEQQWVEILKALYLDAELLILDEPTAVLTPQESARLFGVIRAMRSKGLSVVIITHKLGEVMQSDRVTVLRKGRAIATVETAETTAQALTDLMIGRASDLRIVKRDRRPGRVTVQIEGLCARGTRGENVVEDVSLTVRAGEILGIAGVAGNGQKPLLDLLAGITRPAAGTIAIGDVQLEGQDPLAFMQAGVGLIPEDRFAEGLVGPFSIADNLILGRQRSAALRRGLFVDRARVAACAAKAMADYSIAAPGAETPVMSLSGGNAQKVILARELEQASILLLANQPTRGLDVGITASVHAELLAKREAGCAIILASESLEDLFALSDRLAVMFAGRLVAILDPARTTVEEVGGLMAGRVEART